MSKWTHVNRWVDGSHVIGTFDTREEAYQSMVKFIGHDTYKAGPNGLLSDDGDLSYIIERESV